MIPDLALTRDGYFYLAKVAEQAERYEDMAGYMEKIMLWTPSFKDFTVDERAKFSLAYKTYVGSRRAAWRVVSSIEQKDANADLIKSYRVWIESEISLICERVLVLLDSHLIPFAGSREAKAFYLKMKGDYHRYLAEFKFGEERKKAAREIEAVYTAAQNIAHVELGPTHPVRLGLDLNFAVFYYDIMDSLEMACSMAKQAFEAAVADLNNLGLDFYKDSTLIMQILRQNLTVWTAKAQKRTNVP